VDGFINKKDMYNTMSVTEEYILMKLMK